MRLNPSDNGQDSNNSRIVNSICRDIVGSNVSCLTEGVGPRFGEGERERKRFVFAKEFLTFTLVELDHMVSVVASRVMLLDYSINSSTKEEQLLNAFASLLLLLIAIDEEEAT